MPKKLLIAHVIYRFGMGGLENGLVNIINRLPDERYQHVTICNGVDMEQFQPQEQNDLKLSGLPLGFIKDDTIVIGTVGRMEEVKDQPNLLEVFIELLSSSKVIDKDIKLILVGDGSLKEKLQERVDVAALKNKVWLAGARDDVPELMNLMTIFVLPSLAEGISNTILEAMACGLPVIATNVGGNAELIMNAQTGFVVPRADPDAIKEKCLQYIESPDLLKKHGDLARKRIEEKFSITSMVHNYNTVYLTSLKEKIA